MAYTSKILVVDDDYLGLKTIVDVLSMDGYEMAGVQTGEKALSLVYEFDPDLILLDIMMPDMDGFEVCQQLRADPQTAAIPIIMITALRDSKSRIEGIAAGADDFLIKPFDALELRTRVKNTTRLNRYRTLLAERAKFEIVANRSRDGYLLVSPTGQCLYANPQARLYLGLADDEPIESHMFRPLASKAYQFEPADLWSEWPKPVFGMRYLVRPFTEQFKPLWLQVDTLDRIVTGTEETWVVSMRDVTAEVTSRHELWQFHQAVRHKLRTPFVALFGGLDMLVQHADTLQPEQVQKMATTAYKSARALWTHLENIIKYIQVSDEVMVEQDYFQLADLAPMVEAIGMELELENVQVLLPPTINQKKLLAPARVLELILGQLLENAQKFHPRQRPNILIKVQPVDETAVSIQIIDDGQHLAPEELMRIWEPYYQIEHMFTGEIGGTGLGLAMVSSIVWNLGGKCRMHNRPDKPGLIVELVLLVASEAV